VRLSFGAENPQDCMIESVIFETKDHPQKIPDGRSNYWHRRGMAFDEHIYAFIDEGLVSTMIIILVYDQLYCTIGFGKHIEEKNRIYFILRVQP